MLVKIYMRQCDGCGHRSPIAPTSQKAIAIAKRAGWLREKKKDWCRACAEKREGIRRHATMG